MPNTNNKIFNTRIRLKYDHFNTWTEKNPELLEGEVAIAYLGPKSDTTQTVTPDNGTHPVMFKVGPGNFNNLPWASGLAADVYTWAKQDKITVSKQGTGNVVASISWDASLNDGKGGLKYETAAVATAEGLEDLLEALEGLVERVSALEALLGDELPEGIESTNVIDYVKEAADAATEVANAKVASDSATDKSINVSGDATAPTVKVNISADADNALSLAADGLKVVVPAAPEYSIVKAEDSGEYAAIYNLTKNGVNVGASINIPKDMVVKSGSVIGDNIVLVLNNDEKTEITIPVGSLIEYVTPGSNADDMVVIHIDNDHKVTATITDGSITLAKLASGIQTEINWVTNHKATLESMEGKVSAWDSAEKNANDYTDAEIEKVNGEIAKKANTAELHKVATSGKIEDLDQTDYVVFYCGTATKII